MIEGVKAEAERLGVTRLCHFTPFRNLVHIATGDGLLSSQALTSAEKAAFTAQDVARWDGHPDHICCSVEYPNAWYYRQKAGNDQLFKSWVVLTLDPRHLWQDETRFCHRNASAAHGAYIRDGIDGFVGLYASPVEGAGGMEYSRSSSHLRACPTDNQAEVLVRRFIPLADVQTLAVATSDQAAQVYVGLELIGAEPDRFTFTVVPEFFDAYALKNAISGGTRPPGLVWIPPS